MCVCVCVFYVDTDLVDVPVCIQFVDQYLYGGCSCPTYHMTALVYRVISLVSECY